MAKRQKPAAVREPVQVYLATPDRAILERAALASGLARAEVLRRGLRQFAAELLVHESPALAFLDQAGEAPSGTPSDVAERHDDYLADAEIASWNASVPAPATKRKPRRK